MISFPNNRRARLLATAALLCLPLLAQVQTAPAPARVIHHPTAAPAINSTLIVLDPGHGGSDPGAHLSGDTQEKNLTLAFADQLRTLLAAEGFTVVISRTQGTVPAPPPADPDDPNAVRPPVSTVPVVPTEDQRAEQANRLHPLACLLLHATPAGHGVHLFTSSLTPLIATNEILPVLAWNQAQAPTVNQSTLLASDLSTSLNSIRVPLIVVRTSVPPIDSLTCPAVAIELAPLPGTPVTDAAYQHRVAESVVTAMGFWRDHVETEAAQALAAAEFAAPKAAETTTRKSNNSKPGAQPPTPKPYYPVKPPAPVLPPTYRPLAPVRPPSPVLPPHAPAPIVRRPPSTITPLGAAPRGAQ